MTESGITQVLERLYPNELWPKPLHLLRGCELVEEGTPVKDASRAVGTSANRLAGALSSTNRLRDVTGVAPPSDPTSLENWNRTVGILGQLLLGEVAEKVFEDMFRDQMPDQELRIVDLREGRSDTDYRLVNGSGRPVYRLNIKFHGARFRRARELIGLNPDDSFALATYKIHGALKKQEEEQLPYFFAIVGEPSLSGSAVGSQIPTQFLQVLAFLASAPKVQGKRDLEDRVIDYLSSNHLAPYPRIEGRLRGAQWYLLSARRADRLLREKLFDRVYALRVRNFSRAFGAAEIDMHYSLSEDLIPIEHLFQTIRDSGLHKVTTMLERGDF